MPKKDNANPQTKPNEATLQAVVSKQQKIQRAQDVEDSKKRRKTGDAPVRKKAMQAGARRYPETPLPAQHLR